MKLSVVIPAHNEEENIPKVVPHLIQTLDSANIDREVIVVDDNSRDGTGDLLDSYATTYHGFQVVHRKGAPGFGSAIREGIEKASGDVIVIVMGDCSDDPEDVVKMFREVENGADAVFGSRFIKGSVIRDYPLLKLVINRIANYFLKILYLTKCNDITNAFKMYRREVIDSIGHIESENFEITAELPLKTLRLGFCVVTVPVRWYGRTSGVSKLGIVRMGRHYFSVAIRVRLFWKATRAEPQTEKCIA